MSEELNKISLAIETAFSGLEKWTLNKEYRFDEIKNLLEQKLKDTDPQKITAPETYIAVPAILAVSYSIDNKELQELYINLLAKAINIDIKNSVCPAFIETIKQLSPEDSSYFKYIYSLKNRPAIDIKLEFPNGLTNIIAANVNLFSNEQVKNYILAFENFSRLGLINIPNTSWYDDDSLYTSLITKFKKDYSLPKYKMLYSTATGISFSKKRIDITAYGENFYNICAV